MTVELHKYTKHKLRNSQEFRYEWIWKIVSNHTSIIGFKTKEDAYELIRKYIG